MEIKLYKRPDSHYYWMMWNYLGKLHRQSTKTSKKRDAQKVARAKELMIINGFTGHENTATTFEDLVEWFLNDMEVNKRKSIRRAKNSVDNLSKSFAGKRVLEIKEDDIEEYIKKRLSDGRKNATINRELSALRRMFRIAVEKKKIVQPPNIKLLEEDNVRSDFLEHDEFLKLFDNIIFYIQPVLVFAYKSGWRKETILSLKWSDIDIENRIVWLPGSRTKNKKGVVFIIKDRFLSNILKTCWDEYQYGHIKTDYVFLNLKGTDRIYDFRKRWHEAFNRAGLKSKTFHALRRSFARNAIRAGVSQKVVMEMGGWKTSEVFNRYDITNEKDYREAQDKLEDYLERRTPEEKGDTSTKKEHYGPDRVKHWRERLKEEEEGGKGELDIETWKKGREKEGWEVFGRWDGKSMDTHKKER